MFREVQLQVEKRRRREGECGGRKQAESEAGRLEWPVYGGV